MLLPLFLSVLIYTRLLIGKGGTMHTLKLKHISHEFSYPDFHEFTAQIRHALSSEFFWAVFALVVLIGVMITLAIFTSTGAIQAPDAFPDVPYYPFFP